jgi:hypothetical protein
VLTEGKEIFAEQSPAEERNWGIARRQKLEQFIRRYQIQYPNYAVLEI